MKNISAAVLFLASIIYLAYIPDQSNFIQIISSFVCAFLAYAYFLNSKNKFSLKHIFALGLLARLSILFSFPNLSDDIYRFFWDGYLLEQGVNPYNYLPNEVFQQYPVLQELFGLINSPDYYSIYPPLSQLLFYLSALFEDLRSASIFLKSVFILIEIMSFYFLSKSLMKLDVAEGNIMIYWLNPLIIIELVGNLHFEALMLCFFSMFVYYLILGKFARSGLAIGLSVASKLLPLMFVPLLLKRLFHEKKQLAFFISFIGILLLTFAPFFLSKQFVNFGISIDLYFRKFEFNASVYYLLRQIGIWISGYNLIKYIGPFLSLITLGAIIFFSLKLRLKNTKSILHAFLIVFTIYLLNATTIHPWYLALLLLMNCFFSYKFIIIWSLTIFTSYITYQSPEFIQNYYLIALEYTTVFIVFLCFDQSKMLRNLQLDEGLNTE